MTARKFCASVFLAIALVFASTNGNTASTWIINPTKLPSCEKANQDEFAETLSKADVKVIYDASLKQGDLKLPPKPLQSLTPLLKGKYVTAYLITPSLEELHIGLVVKDFLTLKGEALREFNAMLKSTVASFQELGYGDYLAFCNFGKTYRAVSDKTTVGQCWEMIPSGKNFVTTKNGGYEFAPKVSKNNHMLTDQLPDFKKTNSAMVAQFVKLLKSHFYDKTPYPSTFCKGTFPWKTHITDVEDSKRAVLDYALAFLQESGAVQVIDSSEESKKQALLSQGEGKLSTVIEGTPKTCAFCQESVWKKQGMAKGLNASVLYNRAALRKNAHFMAIPHLHQENLHCLNEVTFNETIEWAQKISHVLGDKKNLVWFCQNGPRSGQTVPHVHLHVLLRPDPLRYATLLLKYLTRDKYNFAEEEECQIVRERFARGLETLP